jgi:hypothetical protein
METGIHEIVEALTALGVILTAVSSIMNRFKLGDVAKKVEETKQAAVAVNAEVVQEVHNAGVAAGRAENGHQSQGS